MFLRRRPGPQLSAVVSLLWATDEPLPSSAWPTGREHVLPTGAMHIAIRLSAASLHVADAAGELRRFSPLVVAGARTTFYAKGGGPSASVGAMLRPGAARALLGAPASTFTGRHIDLADVWGASATRLRDALCALPDSAARLTHFEAALVARLRGQVALDPAVAAAVVAPPHTRISVLVAASGRSHREFDHRFEDAVGLTPRRYLGMRRFQMAIAAMRAGGRTLADIAAATGYADQAHLAREFRRAAGLSPSAYLARRSFRALHVDMAE